LTYQNDDSYPGRGRRADNCPIGTDAHGAIGREGVTAGVGGVLLEAGDLPSCFSQEDGLVAYVVQPGQMVPRSKWIMILFADTSPFLIEVEDGKVVKAPPAERWAVGKAERTVIDHYRREGARVATLG
jgi:hypothetical protein